MNYIMLVLRLTHILAGVFWVGATLITVFYLRRETDGNADKATLTRQHSMIKARLSGAMTLAGVLTVVAGYSMYWIDSDGFSSAWMHSGPGVGFAIGGAAGLLGLIFRILISRKVAVQYKLTSTIAGQATVEQTKQILTHQKTLSMLEHLNVWSLIIAVVFMSIARYLIF